MLFHELSFLALAGLVAAGTHGVGGGGGAYVSQPAQFYGPQIFQQPQVFQQPQLFQSPQFFSAPAFEGPALGIQGGPAFNQIGYGDDGPRFNQIGNVGYASSGNIGYATGGIAFAEVPPVFGGGPIGGTAPVLGGPGGPGGKHGKKQQPAAFVAAPLQYMTESTEERVFREPISRTMTELGTTVQRQRNNVVNHYPMVHEQIRNHVTVQDEAVQNVIHHYYEPKDRYLGVQQGQQYVSQMQIDHPGEMYLAEEFVQPEAELYSIDMPQTQAYQMQGSLSQEVIEAAEEAIRPYTSVSQSVNSLPMDSPTQMMYDTRDVGSQMYSSASASSPSYSSTYYQQAVSRSSDPARRW